MERLERDRRTGLVLETPEAKEALKAAFAKAVDTDSLESLLRIINRYSEPTTKAHGVPTACRARVFSNCEKERPWEMAFTFELWDSDTLSWRHRWNGAWVYHESTNDWGSHT